MSLEPILCSKPFLRVGLRRARRGAPRVPVGDRRSKPVRHRGRYFVLTTSSRGRRWMSGTRAPGFG